MWPAGRVGCTLCSGWASGGAACALEAGRAFWAAPTGSSTAGELRDQIQDSSVEGTGRGPGDWAASQARLHWASEEGVPVSPTKLTAHQVV